MTLTRQAVLHYARERRADRAGYPKRMEVSQRYPPTLAIDQIPSNPVADRTRPCSFYCEIGILDNGGVHRGLVWEIGGSLSGAALWVEDDEIGFRAGGAAAANRSYATWSTGTGELQPGRRLRLMCIADPQNRQVSIYDGGRLIAHDTVVEAWDNNEWAGGNGGGYGTGALLGVPADVPQTGPPNGFQLLSALQIMQYQRYREPVA